METPISITIRIIEDETQLDAIRSDWEALHASSSYASTPLDFVWLREWWRVYGSSYGTGGLRVLTLWRQSRLVGAVPLYMNHGEGRSFDGRHLRFISTGEAENEEACPDYLGLLCLPGEESACADASWREVGKMQWDHLELLDIKDDSPLLRAQSLPGNAEVLSRGNCPVADLTGGFEAYLNRLSAKTRKHARQLLRERVTGMRFEVVDVEHASGVFDDLVRLHHERWTLEGKSGVFAAPRFVEFHRNLMRIWMPTGRAVLARLSVDGDAIAVVYGFVTGKKFDFYQCGVQHGTTGAIRSPGTLANLLLMRVLAQQGVLEYDFLRGSSEYKQRLATHENRLVAIQMWRPSLRTAVHHLQRSAGRVAGRMQRLMSSD